MKLSTGALLLLLNILCFSASAQNEDSIQFQQQYPQKDFLDVLQGLFDGGIMKPRPANDSTKVIFSLLPMVNDGGDKSGIVISANSTFFLGDPQTTRMSNVSFVPYISFEKQIVLPIRAYIFTKNNKYNFTGDYRFMRYPQKTYGLGSDNFKDYQSIIYYNQWRIYQFVTRMLSPNFRIGGGIQMDSYYNMEEVSNVNVTTDYQKYTQGNSENQKSFGLTLQLLFDSRQNIINPQQGYYGEADFRVNTSLIGSDSRWSSLYLDLRKYISLSHIRHKVLATRVFYWSILGGTANYLDLPSIGWDTYGRTGRGFTRNRFRSNSLLYFESEYRTDITKNGLLGAVVFSNISSVSDLNTQKFNSWHPAIGAGIRIKWRKEDSSNMSFDYGISKNDWSIRIGLTENF